MCPTKLLLLLLIAGAIIIWLVLHTSRHEHFTHGDVHKFFLDLEHALAHKKEIPEISDEDLRRMKDDIIAVKHYVDEKIRSREHISFFDTVDFRYWPQYNYTYPLTSVANQYPGNLFTRMDEWSPGFNTSGWKYALRPGVYYSKWPRSRWVKNDGNYFLINNGHFGVGHDYLY